MARRTIRQVALHLVDTYVAQGKPISAAGEYQLHRDFILSPAWNWYVTRFVHGVCSSSGKHRRSGSRGDSPLALGW